MAGTASKKDTLGSKTQFASGTSALTDLPEVAALKRRRRRILGAFLGLLVILGISAKPGYKVVKHWRCTRLAQESADLLERREFDQAFNRARAAHQLFPEEPIALRAVARVLSARGDWPNASAFWAEVVKREPTSADRREFAEAALWTGALPKAAEQVDLLLGSEPNSSENHLLAAKVQLTQRNNAQAVQSARKAVELDVANEPAELLLAQLLLQSPESHAEGLQKLREIARKTSPTGLLALGALTSIADLPSEELPTLARALREHPGAQEIHRLKALELELRSAPEKRAEQLDAAQAQYASAEPEKLRAFATWLNSNGEAARTLKVLTLEHAMTRKDLLLVRLDAMAAQGQWQEILTVLNQDRVALEAPLVQLYKARCWQELNDKTQSDLAWRSALNAASGDPNTLLYIAGYAEKVGAREHAFSCYQTLSQNPKVARIAYEGLLRLTPSIETVALRDLLAEMAQRWPKDVALTNDLAYLNTLLSVNVEQNRETARQLVEAAPQSLPHRTVLALAELRGGNVAAALQVYDGLQIDWRNAAPGAVVVYASALRESGRVEEAKELVSIVAANALRPEEKVLLAKIQES